jgi:hypothetical protein
VKGGGYRGNHNMIFNRERLEQTFVKRALNLYPLVVYVIISGIQLIRVTHPGLGNDFKVFFESGRLVSKGLSPYLKPEYLNGPLHAFFWSLIVKFDSELVLGALRLVSLILIPVVFLQISQILGLHLHSREIFSLSALIQISSFNLTLIAYGQVTLISASLLLAALRAVSRVNGNNSRSAVYSLLFSSISIFLLDYKPHLFLFTLAYLFYIKIRILWIYSLSFGTAYFWFTSHDDFTYIREWIFNVTNRSRGQLALGDQMTIFALPLSLKITIVIIVVIIVGRLILVSGKKMNLRDLYTPNSVFCFTIFFPIVFGPYVHPQDGILLAMFVLAILFARTKIFFRVLPLLLMGMFLTWSVTSIGVLIHSIEIVIVIYLISSTLSIRISLSHLTLCLAPSILFYGLSLSMEIGQIRSAFYFVGLHGLTVLLVLHMIDQKTREQIK